MIDYVNMARERFPWARSIASINSEDKTKKIKILLDNKIDFYIFTNDLVALILTSKSPEELEKLLNVEAEDF